MCVHAASVYIQVGMCMLMNAIKIVIKFVLYTYIPWYKNDYFITFKYIDWYIACILKLIFTLTINWVLLYWLKFYKVKQFGLFIHYSSAKWTVLNDIMYVLRWGATGAQDPKVRMYGAKVRTQGAKVGASISASRYGMQQQHATTTTTTSDHADMTNTARCSNHCNLREGMAMFLKPN